ncbi:DUF6266 family protein [Pedobacter gandavensis]|uniref:Uncharacterized protein n=1 Tax=Pedobacter gandavensis TaxID=2679963 RepID=A0ABR6ET38_9SPHI|nr:DUF6266 family protein [Pedobacter gandavensis]MBB2147568.1 hypothetical protein [Pedobacter gandavensis]
MGSLKNGLFGGFHGRVGNLVGYELNGKSIIRTIGHSTKPLSPARKVNCDRMTIVNKFLREIQVFIKLGFKLKVVGTDRNYYNEAVSYNKKHAVSGVYPNAIMDYSNAMVSMGTLLKAEKPQIKLIETAIEFSWEVPADLPWRNTNDRAMLLLYWPDQNKHTYCLSGSHRKEGKHRLEIDPSLVNERVEAYISFINDDTTEISDSVYAGSIAQNHEKPRLNDHLTEVKPAVNTRATLKTKPYNQSPNPQHTLLNSKLKNKLIVPEKPRTPDIPGQQPPIKLKKLRTLTRNDNKKKR